jgi:hypothetical protein
MGAKGPSGKSKLMKRESEQELDEKAVSKKQQKFMGMVHAAQKGEKAASPEVAKVAKTMKKKDAEDFASTKHKGLPEKVKSKKKEKTEESDAAPTSGKGVQFGKGIYDSLNREIENLIAESMSINASDSTEGGKSLTITATDEDAIKLAGIVRNAGLGGSSDMDSHEHGEVEVVGSQSPISGDEGACETCGSHDCGCGDIEEALAENEPDWPTDEVESDDALQYAGGLNKPKTDVAGDGQTTIPNTAVHTQEEDELRRMMEMAGLQSELKPWERTMKEEQINEGMMHTVKSIVPKAMKVLGGDVVADIANKVKQVTGGDFTPSQENAIKVAKAFGIDKAAQGEQGQQVAEGWGIAGNWQGKLLQLLHLVGVGAGAVAMAGIGAITPLIVGAGLVLLMVADTFWGQEKGKVGAMGNFGNKGFGTEKGGQPDIAEQEQVMAVEEAEELDESKCNECGMYEADCKCSESVEESLARFRSLAGLKEAAKPDYVDLDKDGDKEESMKKAAADKQATDKKVEESIFKMTNLWKAYKG